MTSLEFFVDILPAERCLRGVDSVSNINDYEEYFLGVNVAVA
jgi:hypothetical protein